MQVLQAMGVTKRSASNIGETIAPSSRSQPIGSPSRTPTAAAGTKPQAKRGKLAARWACRLAPAKRRPARMSMRFSTASGVGRNSRDATPEADSPYQSPMNSPRPIRPRISVSAKGRGLPIGSALRRQRGEVPAQRARLAHRQKPRRRPAEDRDVSVAGIDNAEFAGRVAPSLTTVAIPAAEIGEHAARRMIAILAGDDAPTETALDSAPVRRRSTAPPGGR